MSVEGISLYNLQKLNTNLLMAYLKYQEALRMFFASYIDPSKGKSLDSPIAQINQIILPIMQFCANPAVLLPLIQQIAQLQYSMDNSVKNTGSAQPSKSSARSLEKRFSYEGWQNNPFYSFIKEAYIKQMDMLGQMFSNMVFADPKIRQKLEFYSKRLIEALLNLEVINETLQTSGENLLRGAENFWQDVKDSAPNGHFGISTIDKGAFKVGENLAVTPGKVVYQNELLQLIQYTPTTKEVNKIPILIIPAWINKFYILDLQPANSYVKWLVEQGYTVFMVSWVNPHKTFEDYLTQGSLAAIATVQELTKEQQIHCIGYCLGGTLLSATLAYLAAKKLDIVKSATFLATLVDFTECGDVGVFINEPELKYIEDLMARDGFLDGYYLRQTFSMLRVDEMIWSFFVNNYLLGRTPRPFDILYWNADSTRLPASMHSYYLCNLYQKNALVKPGGIVLDGVGIDLRKIKIPIYILATKDDYIAPWEFSFKALAHGGDKRFMLSGSGHVAGVVNHPSKNKYGYWMGEKAQLSPAEWLESAHAAEGSWWSDWVKWLGKFGSAKVPTRQINQAVVIEDAPGSYVKVQ